MFKDFAFKQFELYEVGGARLAASRAVLVVFFFIVANIVWTSRVQEIDFFVFPFRNVRFGVSFAVCGTGLYKRNVSSSEESLFF